MKLHRLLLLLTLVSSHSFGCGIHQDTGFSFVTEPGSLDIFNKVVEQRRSNMLGNAHMTEQAQLTTFTRALSEPYDSKIAFTIFEATKGHYRKVSISEQIQITELHTATDENTLMLVTDLDVMAALATNVLSWEQAKKSGLVQINGEPEAKKALALWFSTVFSA
ncbi:hypothetical protein [Shewanella youngdeokensis]|uniref:SCP2 domain-containing protein n=1 Tax=Shewanella youngdeokensis TaxID=2999068 RepID=A0ABZ0JXR1_9GAMM|nr:hypothetical protein RGE70_13855 [Shewanella sp. DAU334]